ncbi:hypothetical protein ABKN59_001141 [Abortiporus biennis]
MKGENDSTLCIRVRAAEDKREHANRALRLTSNVLAVSTFLQHSKPEEAISVGYFLLSRLESVSGHAICCVADENADSGDGEDSLIVKQYRDRHLKALNIPSALPRSLQYTPCNFLSSYNHILSSLC